MCAELDQLLGGGVAPGEARRARAGVSRAWPDPGSAPFAGAVTRALRAGGQVLPSVPQVTEICGPPGVGKTQASVLPCRAAAAAHLCGDVDAEP